MSVSYSRRALVQIEDIITHIRARNPRASERVARRLKAVADLLDEIPLAGRRTDEPGQRRISASPYPYLIYYRVNADDVVIQRIRHTSRRPI